MWIIDLVTFLTEKNHLNDLVKLAQNGSTEDSYFEQPLGKEYSYYYHFLCLLCKVHSVSTILV